MTPTQVVVMGELGGRACQVIKSLTPYFETLHTVLATLVSIVANRSNPKGIVSSSIAPDLRAIATWRTLCASRSVKFAKFDQKKSRN
jgi:hypothetical protein